ncbi:histidine kinase [Streptomyces sp. NPDC057298]|uniref:histidine kinase n=1 Tax=Streptomyces sp. NPDC057298 TaxID=3346091 RepID=UPI00362F6054
MRGPGAWWRAQSTPAKVETYTRWSFHVFALVEVTAIGLPAFGQVGAPLALWLFPPLVVHALLGSVTSSRALDWTCGRREQPVRLLVALGVLTALLGIGALAVSEHGPAGEDIDTAAGTFFVVVVPFGIGMLALGMRRRRIPALLSGLVAGTWAAAFLIGRPAATATATALAVLVIGGFLCFTSMFSVWLLNAVLELDAARETRTRLAVAEERLRFGRDLHDVMGRNLAVIALKSELAVQLARRERPEAVQQMIEVQRIAHESQREVREVVRGYREADLGAELSGAQGVLTAAGVDCTVTGSATGLPPAVQSALGWVVREATTNVLRHGDARRCRVSLEPAGTHVVLTVENDGVDRGAQERTGEPGAPGEEGPDEGPSAGRGPQLGGGSGLAGLRERLAAVAGTLEAGPVDSDLFRVVAEVPLPPSSPSPSPARSRPRKSSSQPSPSQVPESSPSPSSPSPVPRSVSEEVGS